MSFKPRHFPEHLYFITATLLGWRPLLAQHAFATIILNSLDWHRKEGRFALFAFVIMPTHLHVIIKLAEGRTISDNLQSFGSYTAHAILNELQRQNLASELQFFAENRRLDRTEAHQIWQPIQAKNIHAPEFLREKLEYIHNNPIAKKWQLTAERADYEYSSACFYDMGKEPVVPVDDVRDWLT